MMIKKLLPFAHPNVLRSNNAHPEWSFQINSDAIQMEEFLYSHLSTSIHEGNSIYSNENLTEKLSIRYRIFDQRHVALGMLTPCGVDDTPITTKVCGVITFHDDRIMIPDSVEELIIQCATSYEGNNTWEIKDRMFSSEHWKRLRQSKGIKFSLIAKSETYDAKFALISGSVTIDFHLRRFRKNYKYDYE